MSLKTYDTYVKYKEELLLLCIQYKLLPEMSDIDARAVLTELGIQSYPTATLLIKMAKERSQWKEIVATLNEKRLKP